MKIVMIGSFRVKEFQRKPKEQSGMANRESHATLDTRHKMKQNITDISKQKGVTR